MLEEGLADIEATHEIGEEEFCVGLALKAVPIMAVSALLPVFSRSLGRDLSDGQHLAQRNALWIAK